MSMHAALWRALPADPAGVARACLTYRELEGIVQGVLTSLAQKVLASEPVDQAAVPVSYTHLTLPTILLV